MMLLRNYKVYEVLFVIITLLGMGSGSSVYSSDLKNSSDQSLCKQYHRINATRLVSYLETYDEYDDYQDYRRLTRINFRDTEFTKWMIVEACCNGYEPYELDTEAQKCVPICPSNCINGSCLRPNECTCDQGYDISTNILTGYSECEPYCPGGCPGGRCTEPYTCTCDPGYKSSSNKGSCIPVCTLGTIRAYSCGENASCIAPELCQCDKGYSGWNFNDSKKLPVNFYGQKGDIEIDNYSAKNSSDILCKPLCLPNCHKNSTCIAPNECQCDIGYNNLEKSGQCLPVCEGKCHNGFCHSPNNCQCLPGYKPHGLLGENLCEPICENECVNAQCTKPNNCECAYGYEKLKLASKLHERVSENVCIPICPGKCPNGSCVAPNQCHCNPGYRLAYQQQNLVLNQFCELFCESGCPGSICIAPNQCQFQPARDQDINWLPTSNTRIINSNQDCGINGIITKENNTCMCEYDSDSLRCTESSLCAIIYIDDMETAWEFSNLESIGFLNNGTVRSDNLNNSDGEDEKFSWTKARCNDECRISIVTKETVERVVSINDIDCYRLKVHNSTTGLLSPWRGTLMQTNETLLCVVNSVNGSLCDVIPSGMINDRSNLKSTVSWIVLYAFVIVALSITIYIVQIKIRSIIKCSRGPPNTNENVSEQSEAVEFPFLQT